MTVFGFSLQIKPLKIIQEILPLSICSKHFQRAEWGIFFDLVLAVSSSEKTSSMPASNLESKKAL